MTNTIYKREYNRQTIGNAWKGNHAMDHNKHMFDMCVFKQTIDDSMGINWTLLLGDLLHYSYKKYFIQRLLKKSENSLTHIGHSRYGFPNTTSKWYGPIIWRYGFVLPDIQICKVSFLTGSRCQFRGVCQAMKQT
jgi:hypothetical protein